MTQFRRLAARLSVYDGSIGTATVLVGLRSITLIAKLVLAIVLARYLPISDLGVYGLIVATVLLLINILGADFYSYTTRELLGGTRAIWPSLIRNQAVVHGIMYVAILPFVFSIFLLGIIPWRYALPLYVLILLEHISQELYRLLIAISKPVWAMAALFLRGGLWAVVCVLVFLVATGLRSLDVVLVAWIGGSAASVAVSCYPLRELDWQHGISMPVDREWIRRGIRLVAPVFLGSLALRGITTVDRYIVDQFWGKDIVGVYTFYAMLANSVLTFVDAGVIALIYPKLVETMQRGDLVSYSIHFRRFRRSTLIVSLSMVVVASAAIHPITYMIGRPEFQDNIVVFYTLLIAMFVYVVGLIPHYGLYAQRRDNVIVKSHIVGLSVTSGLCLVTIPSVGPLGAAMSLLVGFTVVGIMKARAGGGAVVPGVNTTTVNGG